MKIRPCLLSIRVLLLFSLLACSGEQAKKTANAKLQQQHKTSALSDIDKASHLLPPAALAVVWLDVKKLRSSPLWPDLQGVSTDKLSKLPIGKIVENLDYAALGVYPSSSGIETLVLADGTFDADESFEIVKEWAKGAGAVPLPLEVRGRRAVKIKSSLFVRLAETLYGSGPEVLVSYSADLIDQKRTGNASTPSLKYLFKKSTLEDPLVVVYFRVPPLLGDWLKKRRLESLAGGSLMLSLKAGEKVSFRVGLVAGKDIKPIWFANEVNTFLVRSAKDGRIKALKLDKWVENLDAKLLDDGVMIEGEIEKEKFVEVAKKLLP